jgi:hypothetical protein
MLRGGEACSRLVLAGLPETAETTDFQGVVDLLTPLEKFV